MHRVTAACDRLRPTPPLAHRCGSTSTYCGAGCVGAPYGTCSVVSRTPTPTATGTPGGAQSGVTPLTPDGSCGAAAGYACVTGECCSLYGWCVLLHGKGGGRAGVGARAQRDRSAPTPHAQVWHHGCLLRGWLRGSALRYMLRYVAHAHRNPDEQGHTAAAGHAKRRAEQRDDSHRHTLAYGRQHTHHRCALADALADARGYTHADALADARGYAHADALTHAHTDACRHAHSELLGGPRPGVSRGHDRLLVHRARDCGHHLR